MFSEFRDINQLKQKNILTIYLQKSNINYLHLNKTVNNFHKLMSRVLRNSDSIDLKIVFQVKYRFKNFSISLYYLSLNTALRDNEPIAQFRKYENRKH